MDYLYLFFNIWTCNRWTNVLLRRDERTSAVWYIRSLAISLISPSPWSCGSLIVAGSTRLPHVSFAPRICSTSSTTTGTSEYIHTMRTVSLSAENFQVCIWCRKGYYTYNRAPFTLVFMGPERGRPWFIIARTVPRTNYGFCKSQVTVFETCSLLNIVFPCCIHWSSHWW